MVGKEFGVGDAVGRDSEAAVGQAPDFRPPSTPSPAKRPVRRRDDGGRLSRRAGVTDGLKVLKLDDNTILICRSGQRSTGQCFMTWDASGHGLPDMGRATRERGLDPRLRPCPLARRWPGQVKSDTTSYAMFLRNGLPADLRGHHWREGPRHRRRRPDRCARREEREGQSQLAA